MAVGSRPPAPVAASGLEPEAGAATEAPAPRWLDDVPALVAGLALVAVFVAWGQLGGGYDPTRWLPGALLVFGLLAAVLLGSRSDIRSSRRAWLALAFLAGFALWSYASILWAGVQGDAWTGANRTLMYTAVFALFLLLPWTPRSALILLWGFGAGVTVLAAHAIVVMATRDGDTLFIDGRFSYPLGYANGNVGFWMAGFWIALALATRRDQPVLVRSLAMGGAVLLPQAAVIVQSRASLVAVPLAAFLLLVATPGRLRTGLGLALVAVPLAVGWSIHGDVYERAELGGRLLESATEASARFIAVTAVLGALVGLGWALADRRVAISARTTRRVGYAVLAALVVVLLASTVAVARSDPVGHLRVAWDEFTSNESADDEQTRFRTLGGERWDHWRVGIDRFLDRPITGIGAEQFNVDYLRERRTSVDARYVHSLEIGILSQLGIVGGLLFGAFAVLATLLAWPRSGDDPVVRTVRLGVFGLWLYWLVHASFDWFYELPAVTAPVFAFLGLAAALGTRTQPAPYTLARRIATVGALVACVFALVVLAPPYLAARDVKAATTVWATDPEAAFDRLERARGLNPLSDEPDLHAAAIATRLDDRARMRLYFRRVLERNPYNWYAHLQLGLTYSLDGRRREALREVRRAAELNPSDPILEDVLQRLERGQTVRPRAVDRLFVERILERLR